MLPGAAWESLSSWHWAGSSAGNCGGRRLALGPGCERLLSQHDPEESWGDKAASQWGGRGLGAAGLFPGACLLQRGLNTGQGQAKPSALRGSYSDQDRFGIG